MSDQPENLNADQQRLLASVSAVESQFTQPEDGTEQGNAATELLDPVEENADLLQSLLDLLVPVLPFLPEIYTPKVVKQIATAYTKVEQKHGWNTRDIMSCELQLALVAIPPTIAAVMVSKEYFKQLKEQRDRERTVEAEGGGKDGSQQ